MTNINYQPCPICQSPSTIIDLPAGGDGNKIECFRCGVFKISRTALASKPRFNNMQIASLSGWLRQNKNHFINSNQWEDLSKLKLLTVGDKATRLMKFIANKRPIPGEWIQIDFQSIYDLKTLEENREYSAEVFKKLENSLPFLAITQAINGSELRYLTSDYLVQEQGYLTGEKRYKITPKGWAYLDRIRNTNLHSNVVFIASKYEKKINDFLDNNVVSALEELKYRPKLMRSHTHTNIIDNEMISLIKQSKFIIVDLTKNSLGAYYEAGYAHGFGLEVIFLCEKSFRENKKNDKSKGVHFDTNHYPINDWEYKDGSGFKKKLCHLIDVKFGKGSYNFE